MPFPIPKTIYMCHKNLGHIQKYSKNWKILNPDWDIKLYDDSMCESFLLNEFSELHRDIFRFIPDGPIKSDFWRVCILFKNGGLYVDADIEPLVSLSEYIEDDDYFVTCISTNFGIPYRGQFNPHFILANKNDETLRDCMNKYIEHYVNRNFENFQYYYWRWTICNFMYMSFIHDKDTIIHYDNGKKYKFLHEITYDRCSFNGKIVLNNRYEHYHNHQFTDPI